MVDFPLKGGSVRITRTRPKKAFDSVLTLLKPLFAPGSRVRRVYAQLQARFGLNAPHLGVMRVRKALDTLRDIPSVGDVSSCASTRTHQAELTKQLVNINNLSKRRLNPKLSET